MGLRALAVALVLVSGTLAATPALAVSSCGGLQDSCQCGGNNPYPCCENNGNCTWYAWHAACCHWGVACPGWGNANTWAGYASSNPNFKVKSSPTANCIADRVTPQYPGDQWGHVAWVESVGGSLKVTEMGCWAWSGVKTSWYSLGYFDKYICLAGEENPGGPIGPSCGDGACNGGETCSSCSEDCGKCCGNGSCGNGETCKSCEQDCGPCCGNGACDYEETCKSCEADCGPCCPNGACDYGETCQTCEADCGPCCGNGACDSFIPEHCFNCAVDCGKCCGNGSCDWGETCELCPQDCGICVYVPQGYLEKADCQVVRGWADDPESVAPVTVEVLVDDVSLGELTADEPTGEHGPCGFEVPWPEALKDGEAHVVKVLAHGGEGLAPGTLPGSGRWVLCGSGTAQKGIWTLAWEEAGGLGIDLNPTFEDGSSLALVHPGDKPYPVSGRVTATTVLGPDPVDEVRFQAEGTLDPAVYEVSLGSGGETQGLEDDGEHSWVPAGQPGAVTVTFASLASVVDPAHRVLQLTGLAARTGPWWNTYSWDAAGFTWSHGDTDRVAFELRAGAAPATRGDADCWHLFGEAFDGVSFEVDQDLVAGLAVQVLVDGTLALHLGPSFLLPEVDLEAPGEELRFRFVSQPDLAVPPGAGVRLSRVRVHKSRTEALYPWQVTWDRAWALSPALPDLPHHGLAVRLSTEDAGGWFSSGTLEARTQVAEGACGEGCRPEEPDSREPEHDVPAFDRVRGLLSAGISAPYVARLQVNDEVVREITAALPVSEPFDLEKDGWFFGVSLAVDPASLGTTPGWVELSGVSFHRGGWWSTADNDTRGLADTRLEDCGVRLQAQPGWAEAGLEASGQLLVHRELATAVSGVRFRRSGGDGTQGLVLSLMADGQDVLNLASPEGEALESWRGQVRSVGFRVTVSQPAVFPTPWVVDLSDVEVEVAGAWQSICSRPESEDWQVICSGEACGGDPGDDPGDDPEGAGGETSGSCARAPVSGSLSPWLLLAALGLFLRRRRMAS